MTVATSSNRNDYTAGAGQTIFPYTFRIFAASDLMVFRNGLLKANITDYTVSGAGNASGGNVVFNAGLPGGDTVTLVRSLPFTQGTDYRELTSFPAESVEALFDRLVMLCQQLNEVDARALVLNVASLFRNLTVDDPVASKYLRIKGDLSGVEMADIQTAGAIGVPIVATNGGTGITSYTVGDLLFASTTTALAKLAAAAKGHVLLNQGAGVAPVMSELGAFSFLYNGDFLVWGAGTSVSPTGWTLSGAGATVARDAANTKVGPYSVGVTRSGADCNMQTDDITTYAGFGPVARWKGKTVTFGAWVRATVASRARIYISDNVVATTSAFHSGGGAFEWLQVTQTIDAGATAVLCGLSIVNGNTTAQVSGATLVYGRGVADYVPSGWRGRKCTIVFGGGAALGSGTTGWAAGGDVWQNSDSTRSQVPVPYKGVARRLFARQNAAPGGGQTRVYTLRKNASATALVATVADAATSASDVANEVAFAAGDTMQMQCVASASAGGSSSGVGVEYEEIP